MARKSISNNFIVMYLIGLIPFVMIGVFVSDISPTMLVQSVYEYIANDLSWNAGIIAPHYPITSSFISIYNAVIAPVIALSIWLFNRQAYLPLDNKQLQEYTLKNHFYAIIQLSFPYLVIASIMVYFSFDLSRAMFGLNIFSWSNWGIIIFYAIFSFPLWLFINIVAVYILFELSSKFTRRKKK
ncbi:hypothetical protein ACGVWS_04740 [Enterobacteriaceae bacterium LUAb1]